VSAALLSGCASSGVKNPSGVPVTECAGALTRFLLLVATAEKSRTGMAGAKDTPFFAFKLHQFLTENIGNKHLEKHLTAVSTLLRIAETWEDFLGLFARAFPRPP